VVVERETSISIGNRVFAMMRLPGVQGRPFQSLLITWVGAQVKRRAPAELDHDH
jgi:hypothetical protein